MSESNRKVQTFVNVEFCDMIEAEIVDADSRNLAFQLWAHDDDTVTCRLENPIKEPGIGDARAVMFRRSRDAVRAMLHGVLDQLDKVTAREPVEQFEEPAPEEFIDPPEFRPAEPWLPRS